MMAGLPAFESDDKWIFTLSHFGGETPCQPFKRDSRRPVRLTVYNANIGLPATPRKIEISSETTKEEAKQIFERGLDMINNCVMEFFLIEVGKATTSKQFEALVQDRCGPQQRYVVLVMTQRGGKPGEPDEVAKMQGSIDGMRRSIVVKYAQLRRTLHPHASKGKQCQVSEYQCAIQND
jgi:hypothetical protein